MAVRRLRRRRPPMARSRWQMNQSRRPVDEFRMTGFSRDPAVKRLAELDDNHEIVGLLCPSVADGIIRQACGTAGASRNTLLKFFPDRKTRITRWEVCLSSREIKNPYVVVLTKRHMCHMP